MIDVISCGLMRYSEKCAMQKYTTERELMFRAGKALYENIKFIPPVAIVCGKGNNAGDGYVLAQLLKKDGIECTVFTLSDKFTEASEYYYGLCLKEGVPVCQYSENTAFEKFCTIVDCIFGTGFKGEVKGVEREVIERINASGKYVVSVDINSGLNADTGISDCCVISDITASVGTYKTGHFFNTAKDVMKEKINLGIGVEICGKAYRLFCGEDAKKCFPARKNFSHKGDFGYVAIIGGSLKFAGAVKLANSAGSAMCSGAGVVKLAVPARIADSVSPYLLESTLFPLSDNGSEMVLNRKEIDELVSNVKSIAFGMGAGRGEGVKDILSYLLENYCGTLIIDADGINCLSRIDREILKSAKAKVIITPHAKEFSVLTGLSVEEIVSRPAETALNFAKENGIIVLLKGTSTVVSDGEEVYIVDRGCAGMATAGSGDVLSGIICAVTAYNGDRLSEAVATSAYVNGLAGELAQKEWGATSAVASDTVKYIKQAVALLAQGQ